MVTRYDYQQEAVDACFKVLTELMTILGEFRDHIVLIGGWVPFFLLSDHKTEHTGTLDIDLALDLKKITMDSYRTVLELLTRHQYQQGSQPFIFFRDITSESGRILKVQVDLLSGEYGGTTKRHRTQIVQDTRARKARGSDLAFQHNVTVTLSGNLPDGAENSVKIKIAGVVPFLTMKGMVLWESYKEKHAYDIYFIVRYFPGGIKTLATEFELLRDNKLVQEGLRKIRSKFENINSIGPAWVATFEGIEDPEGKSIIQRDAFERVNALLDLLKIQTFE